MENKARQIALNYLSRRDYSSSELTQKLQAKGCTWEDIQTVILSLQSSGLIDDEKFIANFVAQKHNKGYGPHRISFELKRHGIALTIEEISAIADNAWLDALQKIWQKRFKGKSPTNLKERAKQFRFLQYRGFTQEQIAKFFDAEFNLTSG